MVDGGNNNAEAAVSAIETTSVRNEGNRYGDFDRKAKDILSHKSPQVGREADDKEESSSSNGSDGGKGNGGGGGYNADCSSSDSSSNNEAALPKKEATNLNMSACEGDTQGEVSSNRNTSSSGIGNNPTASLLPKVDQSGKKGASHRDNISSPENAFLFKTRKRQHHGKVDDVKQCLPQWNGVKIQHPMDPRIDLSTVGFIGSSQLSLFPNNVNDAVTNQNLAPNQQRLSSYSNVGNINEAPEVPSVEQYTSLLEVSEHP